MKKHIIIALTLLTCISNLAFGQALFDFQVPDFYTNRLKTISFFMQRFNRQDIPTYLDSSDANLPYLQVISCFQIDSVKYRKDEVIEFAQHMVDSNVTLSYSMPNYYCELDCKASYKGLPTNIILRMVVDKTPQGFYTWSIADAEGEVLKIIPNRITQSMYISPVDDDQYFLSLRDALNDHPEDIRINAFSYWTIDETSTFIALVASKLLKIETIEDMQYVFDVGGYFFKVHCIDRETNNNGWLIYNFQKK